MGKPTDIQTVGAALYFLPVRARVPLKFGSETLTEVTCARARVTIRDQKGRQATGWGETPLSVQWVWPGLLPYDERHELLKKFCIQLAELWSSYRKHSHPIEIGHEFQTEILPGFLKGFNHSNRRPKEESPACTRMPWLAALLCCSPFDLAVHDAYGKMAARPVYETYTSDFMNRDLAAYLQPAANTSVTFRGKYPADFFTARPPQRLVAWHLVGGLDPLDPTDPRGDEPQDGYPVLLSDWIKRDGLTCLKIKLRGNDEPWDYERVVRVGEIGADNAVNWLSVDFNCTVTDPEYVNRILDRLRDHHPRIYGMILYVEQPFPYELDRFPIDAHGVSARKPLFLDESAHDWARVRQGRELGWTGVALKTCKTQTGALLSGCWARAHGMGLMVQDLTNPMLAQIPHVQLAAHFPTIMGVETNAMQFYPDASSAEARIHPGLYQRREGVVDLSTLKGAGFGYRLDEISRELPAPAVEFEG
jgi:L-alanine-DL-glutamate epimerase-like enolase superfamily enzyme